MRQLPYYDASTKRVDGNLARLMHAYVRRDIARALIAFDHNRTKTALWLGTSRRTLQHRIGDLGLRSRVAIDIAAAEGDAELRARALGSAANDMAAEPEPVSVAS